MKTKKIIITLLMLILVSIITYGFVSKKAFSYFTSSSEPNTEILGIWYLESDSNVKLEFTINNQMKTYIDNVIESTDYYSISNSCNGQTISDNRLFLKVTDSEDGSTYCNIINGVNEDDSNILSMISESGQILVYIR